MSEIDEMIGYVEEWLNGDEGSGVLNDRVIYPKLIAEVRRLRAAVEAVRALPSYDHMDTYMALRDGGDWIDRDDVLAILEGDDGR